MRSAWLKRRRPVWENNNTNLEMLNTAIKAAEAAGEIVKRYFEKTGLERKTKDDATFVTLADKEAEDAIIKVIKAEYPDHGILGEETGRGNSQSSYLWVIDPLDGTTNFVNGIPIFATSIALIENGLPIVGVVHNPITNSLYAAEKGKGATYNGRSAYVSDQGAKEGVITFGPGVGEKEKFSVLFSQSGVIFKSRRYLGSTALELGFVSRGGTEGVIVIGLNKWDYAAGVLLVQEAGGMITDWQGKPCTLDQNFFIASNGKVHKELLELVKVAR